MVRLLIGLALMPGAAAALGVAAQIFGRLAADSRAAAPFVAGAAFCVLLRFFVDLSESVPGALIRRIYVFGHELTHALSAWALGGKVHGFKVGPDGGHVDLSHSNAFVALAPYCVPVYAIAVVFGYRIILWLKPHWGAESFYLAAMGMALAFHVIFTFDCLWAEKQPDLAAAGGVVFSLSLIALSNGVLVMVLLKALFPRQIMLTEGLRRVAALGLWPWRNLARLLLDAGGFRV